MPALQCCLNGGRNPADHQGVPVTAEELALEAKKVAALGVTAFHLHARDADGRESLHVEDVAAAVCAVRSAVPGARVGLTTRAEACPDRATRLRLVEAWPSPAGGGPDFASVNWHEPGAADVAAALAFSDIGVEAGLFTADAARAFASVVREGVERVLVEVSPAWSASLDGVAAARLILAELAASRTHDVLRGIPVLVHGEEAWAWPVLGWAAGQGHELRVGLEDTLVRPDGRAARDNADLVRLVLGRAEIGQGSFVELSDGLRMYHETHGHGDGPPLLLVHGGSQTIGLAWSELLPSLALNRTVVAVELQGHGHTPDRPEGFELGRMAEDLHELLGALDAAPADVFGFSLGGRATLELALRHPGDVRRLVLGSVAWWDGERRSREPGGLLASRVGQQVTREEVAAMNAAYRAVAPDPDHYQTREDALDAMIRTLPGRCAEDVATIGAPSLVVVGDRDTVPLAEAAGLAAALPAAELLVLPATRHVDVTRRAGLLLPALSRFLG